MIVQIWHPVLESGSKKTPCLGFEGQKVYPDRRHVSVWHINAITPPPGAKGSVELDVKANVEERFPLYWFSARFFLGGAVFLNNNVLFLLLLPLFLKILGGKNVLGPEEGKSHLGEPSP